MHSQAQTGIRVRTTETRDDLIYGERVADQRIAGRYPLDAGVTFSWDGRDGRHHKGRGRTRDVSKKGAYIIAAECPPPKSAVALNILLPTMAGESRPLRIEAEGFVVRVESSRDTKTGCGFAVSSRRASLRTV